MCIEDILIVRQAAQIQYIFITICKCKIACILGMSITSTLRNLGLSAVHSFIRSNHHGKYTAWPHLRISFKYLTAVVMQYSSQKPKQEFTFSILRLPRLSSRTIAPLVSPFIHVTCLSKDGIAQLNEELTVC